MPQKRANPEYGKDVLQIYPDLRLNLGHFGGADSVGSAMIKWGWARKIATLRQAKNY